ncbi:MAG TPA: hydroxymethylbilane synthase, partial [Albitalea sp.]|nr:hydroxymethylbilane synthase [Albitalea sp.]
MTERIIIATRESRLALWQAEHVRDLLAQRFGATVELLG